MVSQRKKLPFLCVFATPKELRFGVGGGGSSWLGLAWLLDLTFANSILGISREGYEGKIVKSLSSRNGKLGKQVKGKEKKKKQFKKI